MDSGLINGVLFVDLRKAFDTVDHAILIRKLEYYGIRDRELAWFESYLSERSQHCLVNGVLSEKCDIACGVPQGSIQALS